jgi:hypothetical protein
MNDDEALDDIFSQCGSLASGFTWLEWGITSYWLNNPSFSLKVGPDNSQIENNRHLSHNFTFFPSEAVWSRGENYTVRLWATKAAGIGDVRDHADRTVTYVGEPQMVDESVTYTESQRKLYSDSPSAWIKVRPGNPNDYHFRRDLDEDDADLKSCAIATFTEDSPPQFLRYVDGHFNSDGSFEAEATFPGDTFPEGKIVNVRTSCELEPNSDETQEQLGQPLVRGDSRRATSLLRVTVGKKTTLVAGQPVDRPVVIPYLTGLHASFLSDPDQVEVVGTLGPIDPSVVPEKTTLDTRVNGGTWRRATNAYWTTGQDFSFTLSDAEVLGLTENAQTIVLDIRAKASNGQVSANTRVPFDLPFKNGEFVSLVFLAPSNTHTPLVGENPLLLFPGERNDLTARLTISRPIDRLVMRLTVPDGISAEASATPTIKRISQLGTAVTDEIFNPHWNGSGDDTLFDRVTFSTGEYELVVPVIVARREQLDSIGGMDPIGWVMDGSNSQTVHQQDVHLGDTTFSGKQPVVIQP